MNKQQGTVPKFYINIFFSDSLYKLNILKITFLF